MAREKSLPIRETLRNLFPSVFLAALARSSGAVKRLRQVDLLLRQVADAA